MLVPDIHRMTALARVKLPLFKHFGSAVNAAIKAGQRAGGTAIAAYILVMTGGVITAALGLGVFVG
jgi:hypothetical protein